MASLDPHWGRLVPGSQSRVPRTQCRASGVPSVVGVPAGTTVGCRLRQPPAGRRCGLHPSAHEGPAASELCQPQRPLSLAMVSFAATWMPVYIPFGNIMLIPSIPSTPSTPGTPLSCMRWRIHLSPDPFCTARSSMLPSLRGNCTESSQLGSRKWFRLVLLLFVRFSPVCLLYL